VVSLEGNNDRCFEDRERTLVEFISLFFNTPYTWIAAFLASFGLSFHDSLVLFSYFS
jgi:hypothetical protein